MKNLFYGKRKLMASYYGHEAAIKDLWMTSNAQKFVSASFDRYNRWWDTETGKCLGKYTSNTPVNGQKIKKNSKKFGKNHQILNFFLCRTYQPHRRMDFSSWSN